MAAVHSPSGAMFQIQGRLQRAAALVSQSIGQDGRAAVAGLRHAVKQISRSAGLSPSPGFHPGRYWPVLMIAVALAESAHAPSMNGAYATVKAEAPSAEKPSQVSVPEIAGKAHADMHGPHQRDPIAETHKQKNDAEDPLQKLQLLVNPIPYHGIQNDVTVPDGNLINGGGAGIIPGNDVLPIVHDGISGGGGAGGSSENNNGGDGFTAITSVPDGGVSVDGVGPVYPVFRSGTDVVPVPEPGSLSIILIGGLLLGRRGMRTRI